MSEYQYYEFRAIDRTLTKDEMAEVRKVSTRAEITASRFVNFYSYGDFGGNPLELMEWYYDAHLYLANWGTHELMFAFPRRLLAAEQAKPYCVTHSSQFHLRGDRVILQFISNQEDSRWVDDDEGQEWFDRLVSVRASLAEGDLRVLYLAWLLGVEEEFGFFPEDETDDDEYDEDEYEGGDYGELSSGERSKTLDGKSLEPPVPPGLRQLTEPLKAFAEFLRIDQDLLAVAAERSADLTEVGPSAADLDRWLASVPVAAKDSIISRLLSGEGPGLRLEVLRRYHEETSSGSRAVPVGRKVGELLDAARVHADERKRKESERAAKEKARKEREAAAARAKYLDGLATREGATWTQIETLIDTKQAKPYDQATQLLVDLRDLAARGQSPSFASRLADLRGRHAKKTAFIERLNKAGLREPHPVS